MFAGSGPVIHGPPPPPPPPLPPGLSALVFALTLIAMLWWLLHRFGSRGRKAARIGLFGAAIGCALMELASVMQPDRPTMMEIQRVREEAKSDAHGDRDPKPRPRRGPS